MGARVNPMLEREMLLSNQTVSGSFFAGKNENCVRVNRRTSFEEFYSFAGHLSRR